MRDDPPIPPAIAARMLETARARYAEAKAAGDVEAMARWKRYGQEARKYVDGRGAIA